MKSSFRRLFCLSLLAVCLSSCGGNSPASSVPVSSQDASSESVVSSASATSEEVSSKEVESSGEYDFSSEPDSSDEPRTSEPSSISSAQTSLDPGTHDEWDSLNLKLFGENFRAALQTLINKTGDKTIGYSANNDVLSKSDKALNGNPGIIPFYHDDQQYTTGWNKEHVWPNSRGAGKSGPGSDPQMLRPTANSCNSARGNKFYGTGANEFDPAICSSDGKSGDQFPLYEASRGEAARIIFYVATRYGTASKFHLSNNPGDSTSACTMGTLKYLVQWNNKYPVTAQEIRRNNYLDKDGFARNPFIDNRDFANFIWDEDGLRKSAYTPGSLLEGEDIDPASVEVSDEGSIELSDEVTEIVSEQTSYVSQDLPETLVLDSESGWPTAYPTSEVSATLEGIPFRVLQTAHINSGTVQMKKSVDAFFENAQPFENAKELRLVVTQGDMPIVYAGDEPNPDTEVKPVDGVFPLNGEKYVRVVNKSTGAIFFTSATYTFGE